MFLLVALLACDPEPVETGPVVDVLQEACVPGDYARFSIGEGGEVVSATKCDDSLGWCYSTQFNQDTSGAAGRVYCDEQYTYARVVVIYP